MTGSQDSPGSGTRSTAPREASTVILLREAPAGFEVLLVRRHVNSAFMGGVHVFPGGKVDAPDGAEAVRVRVDAGAPGRCLARLEPTPGRTLDEARAFAHYVAAVRELFEEAGVLLARRDGEAGWISFEHPEVDARFQHWRARLNGGETAFADVLASEGLRLDFGPLAYFAHWLTPSAEPMRFDARFFLARMPEGQTPLVDARETVHQVWHTPTAALAAWARGEIALAPPTSRSLEQLARFDSLGAAFAVARASRIAPILPKHAVHAGAPVILLPWDPDYAQAPGEALALHGVHPQADTPGRFVRRGSRWVSDG